MPGDIPWKDNSIDYSLYGGAESPRPPKATVTSEKNTKPRTVVPDAKLQLEHELQKRSPKDTSDFLWLMTEEPHRSRRMEILKVHPEVKRLMGYTAVTKYVVLAVVLTQLSVAYLLRNTHPLTFRFLFLAYAVGGTLNHNLFLAIHEITHNLAFPGLKRNKLLAMFANIPIAVPYSVTFKQYHLEHHKSLGEDGVDTDLPTKLELICLNNVMGKAFFCTFQILFYALRPGLVRSQRPTFWHAFNIASQVIFDICLWRAWGTYSLFYLLLSSLLAGSLHPLAGHFIAEHYLWDGLEQETYSYYGVLNILAYNVGYHNEHHDFPSIPWTRLPELRAMAPEFYDNLPSHPSWPMVIYNFIMDNEVGIYARAKRQTKSTAGR